MWGNVIIKKNSRKLLSMTDCQVIFFFYHVMICIIFRRDDTRGRRFSWVLDHAPAESRASAPAARQVKIHKGEEGCTNVCQLQGCDLTVEPTLTPESCYKDNSL